MPNDKSTIEKLWDNYDPDKDKDLREFRLNSKVSWIDTATQLQTGNKRMDKLDDRVTKIEKKIDKAGVQVKTGYGVVKTILVFAAEVITVGGVMAGILFPLIKMAINGN